MKRNNLRWFILWIAALAILNAVPAVASDSHSAKHHGDVTKRQAEQIALNKIHGGAIRTAELQTARGRQFWSVYVMKPGSKNAKEVRVDAKTGEILNVQTEKPEDQAEEPPKTH
jgi:peptidase YpeB-like protein